MCIRDSAKYTTPEDRVAVIATQPLTDDEVWTALEPGEVVMFQCGGVAATMRIPVPEAVLEELRNPAFDASASAPRRAFREKHAANAAHPDQKSTGLSPRSSPAPPAASAGYDFGDHPASYTHRRAHETPV
ncbi:class II glutamine amidotransferase, partial [Burkholderia pseudomallei]|uniref:class II glutamine amidotransferase n=1 Tax=Burkholderia pseudomallei TaxID=28450 RepID=UPI003CF0AF08